MKRLVKDVIPPAGVRDGRQFGVHVIDGQDSHSDLGRFVESAVFDEYFGNDLGLMAEEYGPYDNDSTFLTVLDYEREGPVGTIRIIRPSDAGLKSLTDLVTPSSPWYRDEDMTERWLTALGNDLGHTVDIATMAIMPSYRSRHSTRGASAALYSTCIRWSLSRGYNCWVTIVDRNIYDMVQSWGEPMKPFPSTEMRPYLDSPASLPVYFELYEGLEKIKDFDKIMSERLGEVLDIYGLYTRGAGLEGHFMLPDFASSAG